MKFLLVRLKQLLLPSRQFAVFILVGIVNTLFGYSVFALLIFIKLHYTIAVLLNTFLGILFNFKTTGSIVFKNTDKRLLIQFIGVYVILYFLAIFLLKIAKMVGMHNMYAAGAIVSLITPFVSFYLNKRYVFTKATT